MTAKQPAFPYLTDLPELLTPEETAELLGVRTHTIRTAIRRGAIPHTRLGRRIFIPTRALINWLVNPPTQPEP